MAQRQSRVLIVGGGPAGLVLAIELGRRGVPCTLFERNVGPPTFPKANSTTSRTMEHYRRLGIAADIRRLGLPDDYPPDIAYYTRFAAYELARLHWPSRGEELRTRHTADARWPTPEPVHRAQQMFIEPVLKRHVETLPAVDLRFGWRVDAVVQDGEHVRVQATEVLSGKSEELEADYAVGCDGARSLVRETLDIHYEGENAEDRQFLGGRMLATHLDAPAFYACAGVKQSWQYWSINRERFGILVAIDGRGRFVFHTPLPRGCRGSTAYAKELFALATGREFPYRVIDIAEWTAGFALVARRYQTGRIFLLGDAAHLFTPTAGLGYNTSVEDAANLGWKLAAVCRGWGSPRLLATYETERKPVAERNTRFAHSIAEFFRNLVLPPSLEDASEEGAAIRAELGARLYANCAREFDSPGIHFGAYYGRSPIVALEGGAAPSEGSDPYVPQARPGARAPHVWVGDDVALYDRFGLDFTLLKLVEHDTTRLEGAAEERNVPLAVVRIVSEEARDLYASNLVLVRPDHHVAWRGDDVPDDAADLIDRVVGFGAG